MSKFIYRIEALAKHHNRRPFDCGVEELDRYFHTRITQDARKHIAAPFVAVNPQDNSIAGFYTISMSSIITTEFPEEIAGKLPRYPVTPAALIGRLAVDKQHRGKGVGKLLLMDALRRSVASEVAAFCIAVEAKDDNACGFYRNFGFIDLPDTPNRLFLPVKTVMKLFA